MKFLPLILVGGLVAFLFFRSRRAGAVVLPGLFGRTPDDPIVGFGEVGPGQVVAPGPQVIAPFEASPGIIIPS